MKRNRDRDLLAEYLMWSDPRYRRMQKREAKRMERMERRAQKQAKAQDRQVPELAAPLIGVCLAFFVACLASGMHTDR